jgi:chemotaxis protein MotB
MFSRTGRLRRGRRLACTLAGALAGAVALSGCVAQETHDELASTNRALQNRNAELQRDVDANRATVDQLQAQQSRTEQALAQLRADNARLRNAVSDRDGQLRAFNEKLAGVTFGELDAETSRALARLAAENPDLITYDAERGMLRFASDLTFASGSAELRDTASSSIRSLADVLQSAAGAQYEIHVVGHTDQQPMSNPATLRRHGSNTGLSANRAISVRRELVAAGVPPHKIMVAGWGEHRPLVNPGANGVSATNRRVEIFLTRASTPGGPAPSGNDANAPSGGTGQIDRADPPTRRGSEGK